MEPNQHRLLAARWVLPIASEPIENGVVSVLGGRIEAVMTRVEAARQYGPENIHDYGQAIILPGLINLHTHLDYSALSFFDTESGLFDWIRNLTGRAYKWDEQQWRSSALSGAGEIALSGTTCIADSSYRGSAAWALARLGLRGVVGLELFGVEAAQAGGRWQDWLDKYRAACGDPAISAAMDAGLIRLTVAPHAPYTVCPDLWRKAVEWAVQLDLPLLTHVSESEQECRWIAGDEPAIDRFLSAMLPNWAAGPQSLSWKGQGLSPVAHLSRHGLLNSSTVAAHAVKVSDDDLALLRAHGTKIAHCPRSNARLRNGVAPFPKMITAGLEVGFGTDSWASADNLDLLSEARFAWNLHRAVDSNFNHPAERAIYSLTLGAAKILKLADKIGSLEAGKQADIAVFTLRGGAPDAAQRPYTLLLGNQARLSDLFVDGKAIVASGHLRNVAPVTNQRRAKY